MALFRGVRPAEQTHIYNLLNQIAGPIHKHGFKTSDRPTKTLGYTTSNVVEYLTVDSGACDSIAHPSAFPHTNTIITNEYGKVYGACGGESVQNMGTKEVKCITRTGKIFTPKFQIGNKIIKNLLAVSQLCSMGFSVFFGPAPNYDAYICHDPDSFMCHNNDITRINLSNGVYILPIREIIGRMGSKINGALNANDAADPEDSGGASGSAAPHPYSEPLLNPAGGDNGDARMGGEGDIICEESAESPPIRVVKNVFSPSPQDIEKHRASNHVPFRDWCPICVHGMGKEGDHRTQIGNVNVQRFPATERFCQLKTTHRK